MGIQGGLRSGIRAMIRAVRAGALGAAVVALPAFAESAFTLPYPSQTGSVPAVAYADDGTSLGRAHLGMETLDEGWVRIVSEAGRPDGARTQATALLEPIERGESLRLVRERSQSFDAQGRSIGWLLVDHAAGQASCHGPGGELRDRVELPARDRIVNVPMNLFFLPLVRGERETLEFQLFLCREGAQVIDFEAWVDDGAAPGRVEVRYGPDFGPFMSGLARRFAPRLAFWFEPHAPYAWQAHRLPLYRGGPEIIVVRDGVGVDALE